jgi:hypothetical protein
MSPRNRLSKQTFFRLCSKMRVGSLKITSPDGREQTFGPDSALTRAELNVQHESLYYDLLTQGDWGLGWGFVH